MTERLRIFYDVVDANSSTHPQVAMNLLSKEFEFRILACQPQSMLDGWEFWVEFEGTIDWPHYIRVLLWRPVPTSI